MRVLVCGGRDYADRATMERVLMDLSVDALLIHGDARGADKLAAEIWDHWVQRTEPHPADWKRHGNAAGPIRNQEMLDSGIDLVVAFPGGSGTADMVRRAKAAGIEVRLIDTPTEEEQ